MIQIKEREDCILMSNSLIAIDIQKRKDGFGLHTICNTLTGQSFILSENKRRSSLWQIELRDGMGRCFLVSDAVKCRHSYKVEKNSNSLALHLYWNNIDLEKDNDKIDIHVTVTLKKSSSLSHWRLEVINRSSQWGLWEVAFPLIERLGVVGGEASDDYLAVPDGWGCLFRNPARLDELKVRSLRSAPWDPKPTFTYPSGNWTSQFAAFYHKKDGLYLSTYDAEARCKNFVFVPNPDRKTLNFEIFHYPENRVRPQYNYKIPYDVVIGVYQGDWFTAAKIYRSWALQQKWCKKGRLSKRSDVPKWFKEIALWYAPFEDSVETVVQKAIKLKEYFKVPIAVHWYGWSTPSSWDNNFPDLFPAKKGFKEAVKRLHDAKIFVMPYVNGRLCDPDSEAWNKEGAEKYCAKHCSPRVGARGLEKYLEWYDSKQTLIVMCPYTQYWQDKISNIVSRLVGEFGVDGVYLDQIGAAQPRLCFDSQHGHSVGGGSSWVDGYEKLLNEARRKAKLSNSQAILTTEDNAEPYMALLDGYLMFNSVRENLVPIFPAIYGGQTTTFGGCVIKEDLEDSVSFAMKIGQLFVWGAQLGLGWLTGSVGFDILQDRFTSERIYLKELAEYRQVGQKFLQYGEMLRSPKADLEFPTVSGVWNLAGWNFLGNLLFKYKVKLPAILSSTWRAEDNSIGFVLTNISTSAQPVSFTINVEDYGLSAGKRYCLNRIIKSGIEKIAEYRFSRFAIKEVLPGRSVAIWQIHTI